MKTFEQFMTEMPRINHDYSHEFMKDTNIHDLPGQHHMISKTPTHKYWMTGNENIRVTDHHGNIQYGIYGGGEHKKYFNVDSMESSPHRTIKYHEVISHLVHNGHFPQWTSDNSMSKGSISTYRKLVNDKRFQVHHHSYTDDQVKKVTPKNFDSHIDSHNDDPNKTTDSGWFVVRKNK